MTALVWFIGVAAYVAASPAGRRYAVAVSLLALAIVPVLHY